MAQALQKLLHSQNILAPLAWWKTVFGRDFSAVHRFLSPRIGQRSSAYPCPDNPSVSFVIRESGPGYRAFPVGECADDYADLELEWSDVQAWGFDAGGFNAELMEVFKLKNSVAPGLLGLEHVGQCVQNGLSMQVYVCFASSESEVLKAVASLSSNQGVGCILFSERHLAADALLHVRGIGSLPVCECLSLENGGLAGGCANACMSSNQDITNLELQSRFDHRFDTVGKEFASIKAENAELKRDLAGSISNIATKVEPEYFQWILTILGAGSVSGAAKLLDIPNSSFAAKLKQYSDKGGVYATLFSMIKARKGSGVKSVVRFADEFADHQPEHFNSPDHVSDLLDGLENLNAGNWPGVRDELIELVKEELL